jgi:hypothetical protein
MEGILAVFAESGTRREVTSASRAKLSRRGRTRDRTRAGFRPGWTVRPCQAPQASPESDPFEVARTYYRIDPGEMARPPRLEAGAAQLPDARPRAPPCHPPPARAPRAQRHASRSARDPETASHRTREGRALTAGKGVASLDLIRAMAVLLLFSGHHHVVVPLTRAGGIGVGPPVPIIRETAGVGRLV